MKEIEGRERAGGSDIEFILTQVEFELHMEYINGYVQIAGCVSCTYGKSSELEIFHWVLSVHIIKTLQRFEMV